MQCAPARRREAADRLYADIVHPAGFWAAPGSYEGWRAEWIELGSAANTYPLSRMLDYVALEARAGAGPRARAGSGRRRPDSADAGLLALAVIALSALAWSLSVLLSPALLQALARFLFL